MTYLFDTHAHLNDRRMVAEVDQIIVRAEEAGVAKIICAGYDLPSSRTAVELAEKHPQVWATVGIHPHDAKTLDDAVLGEIAALAARPRAVAIGEIGLDFHYDHSPRPVQAEAFRAQLQLAASLGLPVIIHERECGEQAYDILAANLPPAGGVFHCFSGDTGHAEKILSLGFYLGIGGPVTFKNAGKLRDVAASAPADRLLVETDCPYLTPEPFRGRRQNEPGLVKLVAEKLAELRNEDAEEIARLTTENAFRAFPKLSGGSTC